MKEVLMTFMWVLVGSATVASIMELIKWKALENKATRTKMVVLGLALSSVIGAILYYGFTLMGTPVAISLYIIGIYIIQKQMDMKIIRPKIKAIIERKMDKL